MTLPPSKTFLNSRTLLKTTATLTAAAGVFLYLRRASSSATHKPNRIIGMRDVEEEFSAHPCSISSGALPAWLLSTRGTIYRQSGGAFAAHHDFLDGLAHISAFAFTPKGARYSNRFVRQKSYESWKATGRREWGGTNSSEPTQVLLSKLSS